MFCKNIVIAISAETIINTLQKLKIKPGLKCLELRISHLFEAV